MFEQFSFIKSVRKQEKLYLFLRRNFGLNQKTFILIIAALLGVTVAFIAQGVKYGIDSLSTYTYKNQNFSEFVFVFPMLGGLLVGPVVYFIRKHRWQPGGTEEMIKIVRLKRGSFRLRDLAVRFFTSIVTLGTGSSAGKEGPVVHISGGIGANIAHWLKLNHNHARTLSAAGVAAGISAAFQAPIAGSFFALEILLTEFSLDALSIIIVAAVSATAVTQSFGEHASHLLAPAYLFDQPIELLFYAGLGVAGGLIHVLFAKTLVSFRTFFSESRIPGWLSPAIGGFLLGVLAIAFPYVMGEGYEVINGLFMGDIDRINKIYNPTIETTAIITLILVLGVKILGTALTLSSGGSGGTLVPSLFLGTTTGALMASIINAIWPAMNLNIGAWSLVGTSSVLAAMTQAPLHSIMLFFELTRDFEVLLPVFITVAVSVLVSKHFLKNSLYNYSLEHEGIQLYRGMEQSVMQTIPVESVMQRQINLIEPNISLGQIVYSFLHSAFNSGFVVDAQRRYLGVITLEEIKEYVDDENLHNLIVASELAARPEIYVLPHDNLFIALEVMDSHDIYWLPVVNNEDEKIPVGFLTRNKIMSMYNREIVKRGDQNIVFQQNAQGGISSKYLDIGREYRLESIEVPAKWVGKNLRDINLRVNDSLNVIGIRRDRDLTNIIPDVHYTLQDHDYLTVVGKHEDIEKFLDKYKKLIEEHKTSPLNFFRKQKREPHDTK